MESQRLTQPHLSSEPPSLPPRRQTPRDQCRHSQNKRAAKNLETLRRLPADRLLLIYSLCIRHATASGGEKKAEVGSLATLQAARGKLRENGRICHVLSGSVSERFLSLSRDRRPSGLRNEAFVEVRGQ